MIIANKWEEILKLMERKTYKKNEDCLPSKFQNVRVNKYDFCFDDV